MLEDLLESSNSDDPEEKEFIDSLRELAIPRKTFERKYLEDRVQEGQKADIESASIAKVLCIMFGNNQEELRQALKKLTIMAAEKGGDLENSKEELCPLRGLAKKHPDLGLKSMSYEFQTTSNFIFN